MSYYPLELTAVPDAYTPASTLRCPDARKLLVQISNAAVYLQFGQGAAIPIWGSEEPYLPVTGSLVRLFDWVRVRNRTPGQVAQAFLTPVTS